MKLQYKFAGVIFGIGGIFLLAISLMYFIKTRQGDIYSQQLFFEQSALERAEHIGITFKEKAHIAAVLSRSHVLISSLTASNAQFSGLDTDKRRVEIKRLDAAWIQAKNEDDPFVRPYMTNAVAEFFREHERAFPGEYGEIFLTNKYGVTVAATKKLTTLAHAHKYWWIAAYNGGKGRVFFDDRGYDMSAKGYVIGVTIPVVKDGEVIGILKCNHDVTATLSRIVNSFRPGATGRLMVVRGKGKIVLAPGVKPLNSDAPLTLVEKMAGRASGSLILNEGGVQTLAAYAPIKMANGEGEYGFGGTADSIDHLLGNRGEQWFVVISQSMEEAIAESYERTREIARTGIVLIALMGLSAMYFGGRMALPVTRMEKYARRIGEGDYDIPVEPTPGDEMGNLAVAFNQMAINLRTTTSSRDKLAEEVKRRKDAEEKFKDSEQRFRRLAEATFEGITITEKGQFLDTNRAFLDMFGYETVDDVIGKNAVELVAPEYREIVAANIAGGYEKPYEIMGARKDGSFFPIEIRARMMEIPGRRVRVTAIRDITERKQVEEKLAVAHKELESIIEAQPDILYVINMKGELVKWNSALEKLCGLSPEMMMKRPAAEFVCEEDRPTVYNGICEVFEKGSASIEARFIRGDGALVPHLCNGAVWKNPGGETLGFIGVGKDITGRKLSERKLAESEKKFRALFEEMVSGFALNKMVFDEQGNPVDYITIEVNREFERILNATRESVVGKKAYETVPGLDRKWLDIFGKVALTGTPYSYVEYASNLDKWLEGTVFRPQEGLVAGTFIDITDRKRAEKENAAHIRYLTGVNQVYREFELALDLETALPVALNKLLSIFDCDRAFLLYPLDKDARTYKIPFEQTKPEYPGAFAADKELPVTKEVSEIFEATLNASAPLPMNLAEGITDESELKEFEIKTQLVAPLYPKTGKPWMIGLHQCSRVREWTKEDQALFHAISLVISDKLNNFLLVNNLILAKERAEEATKLKDKFVSLVAHDLRSPFASMMGLIEHVTREKPSPLNEENKTILNAALKSGDRMLGIIDELLKISRLQTGQIRPQPRFFKAHMAVAVTIGSISHIAAQKGVVMINDVPLDMRLYADQSLFDEVLLNLLSNAVKFCSKGDKVTFIAPPGLKGAIAVRDTGKGIDEKNISNLFRHEVKTTTPGTDGEIGTGLGLPFSYDIMKAHGGELTVESQYGKGSVFTAILPYVRPIALVVDDDPTALLIARSHLEKIGMEVIEALDGGQALAAIKDKRPHIIITDIIMPGIDGFMLLERLKENSATSDIPVIVMTSADGEARESAFRRGADDFVCKPIMVEDFIPRVRRFVG